MEGGHAGNRPHLIDSDLISLAFVKEELTHLILPPETLVVLNKGVKRVETRVGPDQTSARLADLKAGGGGVILIL